MRNCRAIFVTALFCLGLMACQEETKPVAASKPAAPQQIRTTSNSDGSKTYLASATICLADVPRKGAPQACGWGGSSVSFYAKGSNFVSVDKASLELSRLSVNGTSKLTTRKGEDNFKLGSFPKVSKDGKYVKWTVNVEDGFNQLTDKVTIKGSLTANANGTLVKAETKLFDPYDFNSFGIGSVLIRGTEKAPENDELSKLSEEELIEKLKKLKGKSAKEIRREMEKSGQSFAQLLTAAFEGFFSGLGQRPGKKYIRINMKADLSTVEKVELFDANGNKVKRGGWSGSKGTRSYMFEKPNTKEVKVRLSYWKGLEKVKLNFDF